MAHSDKRGLLAPEPAAQIAALDFAHAREALRRARAASSENDPATADAVTAVLMRAADDLLSIPTSRASEIAEKVSAFALYHGHAFDLSRASEQRRIECDGEPAEQGLLTIYLDLLSLAASGPDRADWTAAESEYQRTAPLAVSDSYPATDDGDAAWEAADDAHVRALGVMIRTPAPDAAALASKLAAVLDHGHSEEKGDTAQDPAFLQRLLDSAGIDGAWPIVCAYQDAIRLSGDTASPLLRPSRPYPPKDGGRI